MSEHIATSEDVDSELEADDSDESPIRTKPWDPSDIRVTTKTWSLKQVVDDIQDGSVDLAPDLQRQSARAFGRHLPS